MSDEDIIKAYHDDYGIDINQSVDTIIRKLTGKKNLKMSDDGSDYKGFTGRFISGS